MTGTVGDSALQELRGALAGRLLRPGDAGYDDARSLFNAMVDVRPAAIAQCTDVTDVRTAIAHGRAHGIPTAVRSGGHSVAGSSTVEDGLVIDVRALKGVTVDPQARTARCGAGVTWGEFDAVTQQHGLATTGGRVSTTGVAGLTLGGGSGWLERKHGLSCDNLRAVELVTADGEHLRASADEHPELFWALHGGGGNFGVATAFEFDLHPVGPEVIAGLMLWPGERGSEVTQLLRAEIEGGAPEELALAVVYLTGPPEPFVPESLRGRLCCGLAFLWAGDDHAAGLAQAEPFRALGPAVDLVGPMPYTQFQSMIDDPPGLRNYWTGDYLDALPDEALDLFVENSERMPVPSACQAILFPWGGAVARNGGEGTPMAKREATWVCHPFALWEQAADDAAHISWARAASADLKRFASGGVYLNFIGDEGSGRVRAAFGESYDRLARVKATYDPDNFFHFNQNIEPASAQPTA
ncbi:FAD-binding oxidoreductase [Conexibacter stalactiti]|uniref:FAD-binding oxidoreductase n=1 Tax=Conexibacter stalactiti TaxID=1940611 RepID=A0ABU4HVF4_9ACTN|nr:FAD-binding oxidoreductase [Conexibacter stalactiti]MDW5597195.1 FAD-binding oxidoreductase [Conexibacter stalactiti]MEC5037837.1 FAD-binding oxidoreductase [Conexibacter stalactiti]